jgi:trans-2,3-dihydro-3-hydroxyanthranilate isomerase
MLGRTPRAYQVVNVFAEQPFCGKTVAVFPDATGLEPTAMALVARELGFPRTAFVFPPTTEGAQTRVRVFTPSVELSSAGLPTIASVYVLQAIANDRSDPASSTRIILEQDEAPVSVAYSAKVYSVRQEVPTFGATYPERETIAALLSLRPDELAEGPIDVARSSVPYLVVPLKNASSLAKIKLRESIWERTLLHFEAPNILAFSAKGTAPGHAAQLRVFTPALGVFEEPASEEACGPLIAYMLREQMGQLSTGTHAVLTQGAELSRKSTLHVSYSHWNGELRDLRVGGPCISIGSGTILV